MFPGFTRDHESLFVRVRQTGSDIARDFQNFRRRDPVHAFAQGTGRQEFAGKIINAVVRADVVHRHQMRMCQFGRDAAFFHELFAERRVRRENGRHHLQRDFAIERFLHRQKDGGHATLAQFADNLVARNVYGVSHSQIGVVGAGQ